MMPLLLTLIAWGSPEATATVAQYTEEYRAQCLKTIKSLPSLISYGGVRIDVDMSKTANRIHFMMIDKRGDQFECTATIDTFIDGDNGCQSWGHPGSGCLGGIEWVGAVGGSLFWEGGGGRIIGYKITKFKSVPLMQALNTPGVEDAVIDRWSETFTDEVEEKQ